MVFPGVMYGCESWTIMKTEHQYFWIAVLGRTLESPLDNKEMKSVSPKGNQPWVFIGRTDAEVPILWPPDVKSQFIGKDPDAGKDRGQEKRMKEDKMVGWLHWLSGYESEQTQGDSECLFMSSVAVVPLLSHVWLCDPMNCSMPGFPVLHHLPEFV